MPNDPSYGWDAFLSQFYRSNPNLGSLEDDGSYAPTFDNPFGASHMLRNNMLRGQRYGQGNQTGQPADWDLLWSSGLLDKYTGGKGMFRQYGGMNSPMNGFGDYLNQNQAMGAIQNAFKDWQTQQQAQHAAPSQTGEPAPVNTANNALGILNAYAMAMPPSAPITNPLSTSYAQMLNSQPMQSQQNAPAWFFQYLR